MSEPLGEDQLGARGTKAGGDPGPPPQATTVDTTQRAKGSKDPGDPAPPPLLIGAAGIAFLAGAHALIAYLTDCLSGLNLALTAAEIAALVTLITWLVQSLHARGSKDPGDPAPPPMSTAPLAVVAALAVLAGAAQIGAALLGECLQGLFAVLGIAELVIAGMILQAISAARGSAQEK